MYAPLSIDIHQQFFQLMDELDVDRFVHFINRFDIPRDIVDDKGLHPFERFFRKDYSIAGFFAFFPLLHQAGFPLDPDLSKRPPILYSALSHPKYFDPVKVLLRHGCARPALWQDQHLLCHAARSTSARCLLLEHGVDPSLPTPQGDNTPLIASCDIRDDETARVLLEKGAPVNALVVRNGHKVSAVDVAIEKDCLPLVKLLLDAGANPLLTLDDPYVLPAHWSPKGRCFSLLQTWRQVYLLENNTPLSPTLPRLRL